MNQRLSSIKTYKVCDKTPMSPLLVLNYGLIPRRSYLIASSRSKAQFVVDDNCCLCHFAGVKAMSRIRSEDVLLASFKNHVFEVCFYYPYIVTQNIIPDI